MQLIGVGDRHPHDLSLRSGAAPDTDHDAVVRAAVAHAGVGVRAELLDQVDGQIEAIVSRADEAGDSGRTPNWSAGAISATARDRNGQVAPALP